MMNISGVNAVAAVYTGYYGQAGFSAGGLGSAGSTSVTQTADGSTITTQRGSFGDIVSVTTTTPAHNPPPQATQSTVDVIA